MAHDVFISYAAEDKPVAEAIRKALEGEGIKCWIAPRDVPVGSNYEEAIIDAICVSRVMILIISANSNKSPHVKREIQNACLEDSPTQILPLRVDAVPLNKSLRYYLSSLQWLDASTPPIEDHLPGLVSDVRSRLSSQDNAVIESGGVRKAIETFEGETKPVAKEEEAKSTPSVGKGIGGLLQQKKLLFAILAALVLVVAAVVIFRAYKSGKRSQPTGAASPPVKQNGGSSSGQVENRLYRQMSQSEKMEFIKQQAQLISAQLGENPQPLDFDALGQIQLWVDGYDKRIDNGSRELWKTDTRLLFQQGKEFAPLIIRTFKDKGVPPIIGLYLPAIESEYTNLCQYKTKGIFQITPVTARKYGHTPAELCDVGTSVDVAAQNMSDLIKSWGRDSSNVTLAVFCFNRDADLLRRDLRAVSGSSQKKPSFWTLVAEQDRLDSEIIKELSYIPMFFAAAIVGENPRTFGLDMEPLSTYTK